MVCLMPLSPNCWDSSRKILLILDTFPFKYEASTTLKKLGLAYDIIDVCVNGCMLFRGEHVNKDQFIKCGEPRHKQVGKSMVQKVLREYFIWNECLAHMHKHN
jgi:hypothetical protein